MKYSFLLVVIFSGALFAQNPIEKEGWELTFNDEFNAKKLNYTKWQDNYYWGGRFNEGGINYYGTEQFQFSDSSLIIVAEKKKAPNGMDYVSGMIDCNQSFAQQYGYFEIRSKLPKSVGLLPAFWLVTKEEWPPEIDIYEIYTNERNIIKTNQHFLGRKKKKGMQPKRYNTKKDGADDFHVYAVEWSRKKIRWFYDNKRIKTSRKGRKYFSYKMHMIINSQLSDENGMDLKNGIFPNYYEIDYVRAYKKKED
ncbi:glycoside hydrolase family 16 protein [Vicingaceae bacterium]|nr:glycoside hydrolase family 16 protein [Vicingaceae bacterium]